MFSAVRSSSCQRSTWLPPGSGLKLTGSISYISNPCLRSSRSSMTFACSKWQMYAQLDTRKPREQFFRDARAAHEVAPFQH